MVKTSPFRQDAFAGKTVVITGAGRGIGYAVAVAFAQHGAAVLAHTGRGDQPKVVASDGLNVWQGDFTKRPIQDAFVDWAGAQTDEVHVLINNAGTMLGRQAFEALNDDRLAQVTELNQLSHVRITQSLLPLLRRAAPSSIINTTSISATTGGSPGSAAYSAAKAYLETFGLALAKELGPSGIRVNNVAPGTIDTDFHTRYSSQEKLDSTAKAVPLQRLGAPPDCVGAYLFLAHQSLAGYITGQTLHVNGGQHVT